MNDLPPHNLPSQSLPSQSLPSQSLPSQSLPSQSLPSQDLPPQSLASQDSMSEDGASSKPAPTPLQCLNGSAIAAALAWGAYSLTHKISTNFAAHPFSSANYVTVNISVAVRTLVVGVFALATGVFALTALGLLGLGIQTLVKKNTGNAGTVHTID